MRDQPIRIETVLCQMLLDPQPDIAFSQLYSHEIIEISMVVSGSGIHRILNQSVPCKEGDVYIINANVPHAYAVNEEGESLTVRRLYFDPKDWLEEEYATPGDPRFCYGIFCDSAITAYAMPSAFTRQEIERLLGSITLELAEKRMEWQKAVAARLSLLLIIVGRYINSAIKNIPAAQPKEWGIISSAIHMVGECFTDPDLTLETTAEALFVSDSYLSRLFKRFTGQSFSNYLRSVRIAHACTLLQKTDVIVEDIVAQCGLRDIPSFYRGFHDIMRMTPNQYRTQQNFNHKGETIMSIINEISENLQKGKAKVVKELVQKAVDEGADVSVILNEGLLAGMNIIGEKFKNNEVYVPEVLVAARAMNMGTQILMPLLASSGVQATGKVCIGTVQGDLHDIGKNLVRMMMEGKGLEVVDLGTDVSPETFVQTAIEQNCQVICCSALLTTTMDIMGEVVKKAEEAGIRDKVKIMVGGAPITEEFCRSIGADVYTSDAASAADAAVELCRA